MGFEGNTKCDQTFILRQRMTLTFVNTHMAFCWYFGGQHQLLRPCFKSVHFCVPLVCCPAGFWPLARS